ncbi:NAD(P)-binding domain-containing protein [Salininema proteolyticum]|uniref:NAD(P)-binding domain-containing protein n=1 Tax=Salininema proteolyticum TaxID=1607685 RepID=A0ABV8U0B8_9ACTN
MQRDARVIVVGAGQAGLGAAYHLRRAGLSAPDDFAVLDRAPAPGGAWQFRWPTLTFRTVNGIFKLPGLDVPDVPVDTPVSGVVSEYFAEYEKRFDLNVRRPVSVDSVESLPDGRLRLETSEGPWTAGALINATGTWERPFWPHYPGRESFAGRQLHTADYAGPWEFAGKRVIVVGGGISGVQHVMEIHPYAASTTWMTRTPPRWAEGEFDRRRGAEAVAMVERRVREGLPPQPVVAVTGIPVTPEVREALDTGVLDRRPVFTEIVPEGVVLADGTVLEADVILWATGFRPVIDHLGPLRLRGPRGGIALAGTQADADERIQLVGYGPSASTVGANRASRSAVRRALAVSSQNASNRRRAPAPDRV